MCPPLFDAMKDNDKGTILRGTDAFLIFQSLYKSINCWISTNKNKCRTLDLLDSWDTSLSLIVVGGSLYEPLRFVVDIMV